MNDIWLHSMAEWSARRRDLYLHSRTQQRNTNIHASSVIRTHDHSDEATKIYAFNSVATRTGLSKADSTLT
jgi:hypothetical protein